MPFQNFRIKKNILSISFLKTFPPSKHQKYFIEIPKFQYPYVNSNTKSFLLSFSSHQPQQIHLVPARYITHVSNNHTSYDRLGFNNIMSLNKMIIYYIRSGNLDFVLKVFESMSVRNTVTWNSILAEFVKKPRKVIEARQMFDRIPEPDNVSYNTMLVCYAHNSDIATARTFFDQMPIKDIASWNTMIFGFSRNGMVSEACEFFSVMLVRNSVTWSAMISGYVESGDLDSAVKLFRIVPVKSVVTWTAMVTGYMKFGRVELAEELFVEMPAKNLVTWNSMIAGYVENCRWEDALKLFRTMVGSDVKPNLLDFFL